MIKTSRQLKDLIRNLSKNKAADAQVLMRNYMLERFLERVVASEYRNNFILKGGMLVAAMVGLDARSTMDIDATIKDRNVDIEDVRKIITDIVSVPIPDDVTFVMKDVSGIMDEAEYPGVRVSMDTYFDGVRTPLKIDISTGDAITPRAIEYSFHLMFEDRSIEVLAYNLETVIAEKLETVIARSELNTRMRDFYDLSVLYQMYGVSINAELLGTALKATTKQRGHDELLAFAEATLSVVENSTEMIRLWKAYQSKFTYAADLSWNDVMRCVRKLAIEAGLDVEPPSVLSLLHDIQEQQRPINQVHKEKNPRQSLDR